MRHAFLAVVLLTVAASGSSAQGGDPNPPLVCSSVAFQARVLPGEPVIIRHEVRNPTARVVKVAFDYWGQRVKSRYREVGGAWKTMNDWLVDDVVWGKVKWGDFKPGQSFEKKDRFSTTELVKPGQYEMQLLLGYSHSWLTSETKLPEGAWTGILECTPARIEVVEPTGVDGEAFAALGPYPLNRKLELIERYPTSAYAGFALLGSFSFEVTPTSTVLRRESNRRHNPERSAAQVAADKHLAELDDKRAALLLSAVESFLAVHPDFPFRPRLELKRAGLLAYFERYEEAKAVATRALDAEDDPDWRIEGQRFLDLLVERGWVKPE